MRLFSWLLAVVAFAPLILGAGPIYGVILFNSSALAGASISIVCPGTTPATGLTLDDGSYRVPVPSQGRCTFTVTSSSFPRPVSTNIVSLQDATQYNFVVVAGSGGYELQRR